MLCISDPTAIHHIVVKDQDTYEETSTFISCGTSHFVVRTCGDPYVARRQNQLMFGMGVLST